MWIAAAFLLLLAFVLTLGLALRRNEEQSLAAAQAAGTIAVLLIVVLAVWWDQSSLFFVALAGVVLSFPSALVMARLLSREIRR